MYINLHKAEIDWLTVTSFEPEFYTYWDSKLAEFGEPYKEESKILQYIGRFWRMEDGGHVYLGSGKQRDRPHDILRISGNAAHVMSPFVWPGVRMSYANVRRIDIQMTIPEPDNWSQWTFFNRMKKRRKHVGWVESASGSKAGQLETVYVGKRTSDRMMRLYIKLSAGDERLLRCEVEFKGDRAHHIARSLANDGELPDNFLRHEIEEIINDQPLMVAFVPSLIGDHPANVRLQVLSSHEKTQRWLLDQVLPTFRRIINDHDNDRSVIDAYMKAIRDTERWNQ